MMHTGISHNVRQLARHSLAWLASTLLLGLPACVQLPATEVKKEDKPILVYPLPPDEARFVYERTIYSNNDVDTSVVAEDNSLRNLAACRIP